MNAPTNAPTPLSLSDFDFSLPPELIAQHPAPERSGSKLLDSTASTPVHRIFHDLPNLLNAGDLLVFNDTKVVKARLFGEKPSGGKVELLIERVLTGNQVVAHMRVSKKPHPGETIWMAGGAFSATLLGRWPLKDGTLFRFVLSNDADDASRYQTVFAKNPGAVAAPTAALHFDEALLAALDNRGVERASITLHVGAGTFQPVKTENIAEHVMHFERYSIDPSTLDAIARCKARDGKVVAVGTTSVRALETWAKTGETQGDTNIFITPGFDFKVVDTLITNFHLPKSSLMMLVSAFAGHAHIMALYAEAIAQQYRFFSYGDAMLLQRENNRNR